MGGQGVWAVRGLWGGADGCSPWRFTYVTGGLGLGSISAFFYKAKRLPQKVLGTSKPVKPWHREGVAHGSFLRHPRTLVQVSGHPEVANSQGPGGKCYWAAPGSGLEEAVWTSLPLPLGGLRGHSIPHIMPTNALMPFSCCVRESQASGKPALGGVGERIGSKKSFFSKNF